MVSCWDRKCHVSTGIYLFGCSIFIHPYISSWLSYIYIQNKTHTFSSHKGKQPMSHPAKVFSRVLKPLLPALNLEYMLGGGCLVPKSCPTLATPRTIACQALLFMGFSRQESGVSCHFLLQGIFLTQESNPDLLHCRQILY